MFSPGGELGEACARDQAAALIFAQPLPIIASQCLYRYAMRPLRRRGDTPWMKGIAGVVSPVLAVARNRGSERWPRRFGAADFHWCGMEIRDMRARAVIPFGWREEICICVSSLGEYSWRLEMGGRYILLCAFSVLTPDDLVL